MRFPYTGRLLYSSSYLPLRAHDRSSNSTANPNFIGTGAPNRAKPTLRGENADIEAFLALVPENFRTSLYRVLSTKWWADNKLEPGKVLDELIRRLPNQRFSCIIAGCNKTYSTRQRALNHLRKEIDHRPYKCSQKCPDPAW
jgi:hypothetical protein